jgi:hypothetical protein
MSRTTLDNADCVISWVSDDEFSGAMLDFSNLTLTQVGVLLKQYDIAYPGFDDVKRVPDAVRVIIGQYFRPRTILEGGGDFALYIPYESHDDYLSEMDKIKNVVEIRLGLKATYANV